MGILQNNWNDVLFLSEQTNKFKLSFSEEFEPYYISREMCAGTFAGENKTIVCYLDKNTCCNCSEYADNKNFPCTHMYRLAYELNLINHKGLVIQEEKSIIHENEKIASFKEIISLVENNLTNEEQLYLSNYPIYYQISKSVSEKIRRPFPIKRNIAETYISAELFEQCLDSNLGIIYHHGFRDEVISKIDNSGYIWPNNLPKTKSGTIKVKAKRDYCLLNPNEIVKLAYPDGDSDYIMVRPTLKFNLIWSEFLQYLERKFNDIESKDKFGRYPVIHPAGAIVSNYRLKEFNFPTDFITDELTKYGHNRCITKKSGVGTGKISKNAKVPFVFSITTPSKSDYNKLYSFLESLAEFYEAIKKNNEFKTFINIFNVLKQFDEFMDKAADNSVALLTISRSLIAKHVKEESEIKKDFLNISITLNSNEIIVGYENIVRSNCTENQISNIYFNQKL